MSTDFKGSVGVDKTAVRRVLLVSAILFLNGILGRLISFSEWIEKQE